MLTNEGQRIGKSRKRFAIPGRLADGQRLTLEQLMSKDGDQRKESEQSRSGAQDGQVGPLSLRLYPQMSANLMKGHFYWPSQHKPLQDSLGRSLLIGTQRRLRIELSLRITNEHPTNRHRWQSVVIPDGCCAGHLERACGTAIPG